MYDAVCLAAAHLWESFNVDKEVGEAREEWLTGLFPADTSPANSTMDDLNELRAEMGLPPIGEAQSPVPNDEVASST